MKFRQRADRRVLSLHIRCQPYALFWIPLLSALGALGWTGTMSFMVLELVPAARMVWWLYPLIIAAVIVGAFAPLLNEAFEIALGRFLMGGLWFIVPSIVQALLSLFRDGWGINALLVDGLLPGFFVCSGYVLATMLGDGCAVLFLDGTAATGGIEQRGQLALRHLSQLLFKAWVVLALFGTLLAEGVFGLPASKAKVPLPAVFFAAAGIVASLLMLSSIHLLNMRRLWEADEDDPITHVSEPPWRDTLLLLMFTVTVAWLLPANVSPVARRGVGGFFERLNDMLGPLLVRTERSSGQGGKGGFAARLSDWLLPTATGGEQADEWLTRLSAVIDALIAPIILLGTGFALWRLYLWLRPRDKKADEGPEYNDRGIIVEFLLWVWERLRSLFTQISAWLGKVVPTREPRKAEAIPRTAQDEGDIAGVSQDALARIKRLFARLLRQLGRAGYPRAADETPYEYAERVSAVRPDAAEELGTVTDIYVEARYSANQEASFLQRAYESLRVSIRHLLHAIRRMNAGRR